MSEPTILDVTVSEWCDYWTAGNDEQWAKDFSMFNNSPVVSTIEMCAAASVMRQLRDAVELYEAMKDGVSIRIADLETAVTIAREERDKALAENARLRMEKDREWRNACDAREAAGKLRASM